ncbi:calcium-binding protein, partial [Pseudomonas borbori]
LNNLIYAGAGNNILDGGAGTDTAAYTYATKGITANLSAAVAQATGGSGSDLLKNFENLTGSKYSDALIGNSAANILNGSSGADRMIGGNGNDTYFVDSAADVISETNASIISGGTDTVYSYLAAYNLGINVENLRILSSGSADATGNNLNNLIYAGAGNNILDGGAGTDTAAYTYATKGITANLSAAVAQATGGSGSDLLKNFENLTGSKYSDALIGNSAANILNGSSGADRMIGGDGDDIYYVENIGDVVKETNANAISGGTDTVYSYLAAYTLGANLENLRLLTNNSADGTGNSLDNIIYAGAGNNVLNGGDGLDTVAYSYAASAVTVSLATNAAQATGGSASDTLLNVENLTGSKYDDELTGDSAANVLNGGAGNDTVIGGAGNDLLVGGLGTDILYGGLGADQFDFNSLIEMGLGSLRDVIGDFNSSEGDKINLSTLDANTATAANDVFSFINSMAFSNTDATGQLRFADGILYGSTNTDANAEFEIQLLGVVSLSNSDLMA